MEDLAIGARGLMMAPWWQSCGTVVRGSEPFCCATELSGPWRLSCMIQGKSQSSLSLLLRIIGTTKKCSHQEPRRTFSFRLLIFLCNHFCLLDNQSDHVTRI